MPQSRRAECSQNAGKRIAFFGAEELKKELNDCDQRRRQGVSGQTMAAND